MASIKKLLKSAPRMRNTLPQNITRGNGVRNPQKASAYVGRGVLKNGDTVTSIKGSISPVPNGPLIKRKGIVRGVSVKGSTLKTGGKVKVLATVKKAPKTAAWTRKEGKNPEGGLNAKGVASYRKANPGSKLKTAVTTKPSKLKAGSKDAKRRKSFCARMSGMKKANTSAKTANDPNSRINKSLRKWNC